MMPHPSSSSLPSGGGLYPSPLSGLIHSRRLGLSLGINVLPADGKVCTFDCLYCECGFNADCRPHRPMPSRQEVAEALEQRLQELVAQGVCPDSLTFSGNGEPTLHPEFTGIIDDVLRLRDRYVPKAMVSVLSNATQVVRDEVRAALMRVDNPIMKLDTVSPQFIREVDRPTGHYDVEQIVEALCRMEGKAIVQTMFLSRHGQSNATEQYTAPWMDALRRIRPKEVMIYTIDRPTPDDSLRKVPPDVLDAIRDLVEGAGFPCIVAY